MKRIIKDLSLAALVVGSIIAISQRDPFKISVYDRSKSAYILHGHKTTIKGFGYNHKKTIDLGLFHKMTFFYKKPCSEFYSRSRFTDIPNMRIIEERGDGCLVYWSQNKLMHNREFDLFSKNFDCEFKEYTGGGGCW